MIVTRKAPDKKKAKKHFELRIYSGKSWVVVGYGHYDLDGYTCIDRPAEGYRIKHDEIKHTIFFEKIPKEEKNGKV